MARLRLQLQRRGFKHVYDTITGQVGEKGGMGGLRGRVTQLGMQSQWMICEKYSTSQNLII